MKIQYYKQLDGVRAIAALMVMFFHFFLSVESSDTVIQLVKRVSVFGQTGVSLFFVLSGFLITRILFVTKHTPNYFYTFYIRRLLRIFPLYYLFLIIYFFVVPFFSHTEIAPWNQQFYYWVYLQGFPMSFHWVHTGPDHFWSLGVEEHFYLFWPFLIYFFNQKKVLTGIIILIVLALFTRIFFLQSGFEVFYFTLTRMDELAMGALIAILEVNKKLTGKNFKKYLVLFVTVLIPTVVLWVLNSSSGSNLLQVIKFNFLSLVYFSIICTVISLRKQSLPNRILKSNWLVYLGKISYGLYVYHPLSFILFKWLFKTENILLGITGCFASTIIFASISYYLFELKFLHLKKYFVYHRSEIQTT